EATDGSDYAFGKIQWGSRVRSESLEQPQRAPTRDRSGLSDTSNGRASTVPTPQDEQLRPAGCRPAQACNEQAATYEGANSPSQRIWQARAQRKTRSNRAARAD